MSVIDDGVVETQNRESREARDHGPRSNLASLWADRRRGFALAGLLAAGFGLVSAWLTPRGPITTEEALATMAVALLLGLVVGFVTRSRWAMVVVPAVFVAVFEIARVGVDGPTVDGIHLGSLYGAIAFVLGRVLHAILAVLPIVVGVSLGVVVADRRGHFRESSMGRSGWIITALATLVLVVLAFFIARPATTAPILGSDGTPLPGSVAEIVSVTVGGHEQVMLIRGRSTDSPVLLYLAGGPGGTDLGAIRSDVTLEQNFVVVAWDQRGAGKSYSALDPTDTFTLDRLVADTVEVTEYLRERFDEERIYLVGQSWGSTLGVLAVQERPDLYHAFVGVGQMVSQRETDVLFWEDALAWAEETGNTGLAETLRGNGPPPYPVVNDYEPIVGTEHDWNPYPDLNLDNEMPAILFVPEYTFMDRVNAFRGFLDTNGTLYPQLQAIDFREDVPRLEVPVYMVLGEHEARGRALLAEEWFDMLEAPQKEWAIFEGSGHRAHFDRPGLFADLMGRVLEATESSSGEAGLGTVGR